MLDRGPRIAVHWSIESYWMPETLRSLKTIFMSAYRSLKVSGTLKPHPLTSDNEEVPQFGYEVSMAIAPPSSAQLPKRLPGSRFDHLFFTGMILLLIGIVFLGFAHSYYLAGILHAPLKSPILQIHGPRHSVHLLGKWKPRSTVTLAQRRSPCPSMKTACCKRVV
jgi:hypothetical protein